MSIEALDRPNRKEALMVEDIRKGDALNDTAPILEKKTDTMGWVKIYAPDVDPRDWDKFPWRFCSEFDLTGNPPGIDCKIKPQYVYEIFDRPYFFDKHKMEHRSDN